MTQPDPSTDPLDQQLEQLARLSGSGSFERVRIAIGQQRSRHRRHLLASLVGAAVAAIGSVHFSLKGDPFGFVALGLTTVVMVWLAIRSARQASDLFDLKTDQSLIAQWRGDLDQQLKQIWHAQWLSLMFSVLTGWVLHRHGLDGKSALYLITAAAIWVFAGYQLLWKRPLLMRERALLDED